jgi:hypothetical protein
MLSNLIAFEVAQTRTACRGLAAEVAFRWHRQQLFSYYYVCHEPAALDLWCIVVWRRARAGVGFP